MSTGKPVTFFSDALKWNRVVAALVLMAVASALAAAQANNAGYGLLVYVLVLIVFSVPTVALSMLHSLLLGRLRPSADAGVMALSIALAALLPVLILVLWVVDKGYRSEGLQQIAPYLVASLAYGVFAGADEVSTRGSIR